MAAGIWVTDQNLKTLKHLNNKKKKKEKKRRLDKRVWENPELSGKRLTVRTPIAQLAPGRVKPVDKARLWTLALGGTRRHRGRGRDN